MLARWLLFQVASGQAFLAGVGCLVLGIGLMGWPDRRCRIARNLLCGLGAVGIGVAAPPVPGWVALTLAGISLVWLVSELGARRVNRWLRGLMVVAWLAVGASEAWLLAIPTLPALGRPTLGIIGDSLTAGTGDPSVLTWPARLAERYHLTIHDHSTAGATVRSAARQAGAIQPDERLILLEIGGNDLLGGTDPTAFEADLARLLALVRRPGRVVVLLELPLVPGFQRFALIQRRLAGQFGVVLIPKRLLAGVLFAEGATIDSVHLSAGGHDRMARAIWDVIRPAYRD